MPHQLWHIINLIPRLRRLAVALVQDRERADELVRTCLENVSSQYGHWLATTDVRVPLFQGVIEVYLSRDWRGAERRRRRMTAPTAPHALPPWKEALKLALEELDKKERIAFLLINLEEMSYEDAATITGDLVSNVRARAHLAQNKVVHSMSMHVRAASQREGRSESNSDEGP